MIALPLLRPEVIHSNLFSVRVTAKKDFTRNSSPLPFLIFLCWLWRCTCCPRHCFILDFRAGGPIYAIFTQNLTCQKQNNRHSHRGISLNHGQMSSGQLYNKGQIWQSTSKTSVLQTSSSRRRLDRHEQSMYIRRVSEKAEFRPCVEKSCFMRRTQA